MALYHLSVKTVSRSSGRSAVGAAAYRTGERLTNARDGVTHDYTRRHGVVSSFIVAPAEAGTWASDRSMLWNTAEQAETRKNSTVAREYELALPAELDAAGRAQLARDFASAVVARFGVVADVALHAPGRAGDQRNHHAHVLTTTRQAGPDGLGAKTRVLDDQKSGAIEDIRALWGDQVNQALERARSPARVDHRSHARQAQAQGRDARDRITPPGVHLGPGATAIERQATRERVRALPENASAMERQRAAHSIGASRRGELANRRQADHLAVAQARHSVREATASVTNLEAERARRAAQEVQAEKEAKERRTQAERDSWRTMPLARLETEVDASRPAPAERVAEQRDDIRKLWRAVQGAEAAVYKAQNSCNELYDQRFALRKTEAEIRNGSSRLALWLHDKGIYQKPALREVRRDLAAVEKRIEAAQAAQPDLITAAKEAEKKAKETHGAARTAAVAAIKDQQRPEREKHAEMVKILNERREAQRHVQERRQEQGRGEDRGR